VHKIEAQQHAQHERQKCRGGVRLRMIQQEKNGKQFSEDGHDHHQQVDQPLMLQPAQLFQMDFQQPL
jgi:hypothetical protein